MTEHYLGASLLVLYLGLPLVAYAAYWVWKRIRREPTDEDAEGGGKL